MSYILQFPHQSGRSIVVIAPRLPIFKKKKEKKEEKEKKGWEIKFKAILYLKKRNGKSNGYAWYGHRVCERFTIILQGSRKIGHTAIPTLVLSSHPTLDLYLLSLAIRKVKLR